MPGLMQIFFQSSFRTRLDIPELMDDPDSDRDKLIRTIKQFRLINLLLSRSRHLIRKYILPRMTPGRSEPYHFLDVGAGGCDIAIWLLSVCRKRGIPVKITCLDYDPRIFAYAKDLTRDIPEIEVVGKSIFEPDELDSVDFAFSNHFLHHFPDKQVTEILEILNRITKNVVLMNDLRRSKAAFLAYRIFAFLFLHNSFAAYDGSVSILRGFSLREMMSIIAKTSGGNTSLVLKKFPGRIVVVSSEDQADK